MPWIKMRLTFTATVEQHATLNDFSPMSVLSNQIHFTFNVLANMNTVKKISVRSYTEDCLANASNVLHVFRHSSGTTS